MSSCSICSVDMAKPRVHYGGVSCYSCRAFFRRTTQREELKKCKFGGECSLSLQLRKSCPPCRYDKCLRAGMRPDLVLDEEEKRKRFKNAKYPDDTSQSSIIRVEDETDPDPPHISSKGDASPDTVSLIGEDKEAEEDFLPIEDVDAESIFMDLSQNESFIDPDTGEFILSGMLFFQSYFLEYF